MCSETYKKYFSFISKLLIQIDQISNNITNKIDGVCIFNNFNDTNTRGNPENYWYLVHGGQLNYIIDGKLIKVFERGDSFGEIVTILLEVLQLLRKLLLLYGY